MLARNRIVFNVISHFRCVERNDVGSEDSADGVRDGGDEYGAGAIYWCAEVKPLRHTRTTGQTYVLLIQRRGAGAAGTSRHSMEYAMHAIVSSIGSS